MQKIIDVPYHSEFDKIDGSVEHIKIFKRRSCGIVSMKMIFDYLSIGNGESKVTLSQLIKSALRHKAYSLEGGGKKENIGWVHSGLLRTAQDLGYIAWRRVFFIRKYDLSIMKKEGIKAESLAEYKKQIAKEATETFKKSIDNESPFMVSVRKNLGSKLMPHLVVVTGYKEEKGSVIGFFINDPNNPKKNGKRPKHKNQYISRGDFVKIWRNTAIFIKPKEQ